tara:strand:- start:128 stop:448 length:321 start_codon:yes stop_codon:yes gene_type:complete
MSLLNKRSQFDLVPGNTPGDTIPKDETLNSMNNLQGLPFDNGPESKIPNQRDTLHERSLEDIYMSQINIEAAYGAGQPGGTWPSLSPTGLDLNGNTPSKYEDNLPG